MSKAKADPHGWPDYTYPMTIIGQELNVAIDIAAQSLPTLDINIAASAVTLDVNITGSDVTLNVNIAGQAANLNIDIAAQSVAIKGLTDWAAENATDVDVCGSALVDSGMLTRVVEYTVPSGKTLLIYDWAAGNMWSENPIWAKLTNDTDAVDLAFGGGGRGFETPFSKPKRVAAGKRVSIYVRQDSGSSQECFGHFGGVLL